VNELYPYIGQKEDLVHNSYQYVNYETFDGKTVFAYLSLPKGELKGAIITAFYGGSNYYSFVDQLLTELGFALLSPAVRGSWSYGLEWRELIKGDLGGDEILDLHWGAKYLEQRLNLKPQQIGLRGGSHGGYSVLRALTMPEGFKGVQGSSYPYGFGICWAGFADLEDMYRTSNIPDWLVNMLGPYEGNQDKYRERSPIHFFDNLNAPLFISHGGNDVRVSPTSMEGFLEKLRHSDKDYVIHMMEGLGHGAGNKEEEKKLYSDLITFLERVASSWA
jgi:dipeptidyl aminopeptidase/acylaminoacyl peptidase